MATGTLERLEDRLADLCGHRNVWTPNWCGSSPKRSRPVRGRCRGSFSPAHWLAWKAGLSGPTPPTNRLGCRRRRELSVTFAAFDAGELSLDQVAPIAAKAPRWADARVVRVRPVGDRHAVAAGDALVRFPPRPRPEDDPAATGPAACCGRSGRVVSMWHRDDGRWELRGELDAEHGAVVGHRLARGPRRPVPTRQLRASKVDALVEIANRSLDSIDDVGRRDRYRVHVHLDVDNAIVDGWATGSPTGCVI